MTDAKSNALVKVACAGALTCYVSFLVGGCASNDEYLGAPEGTPGVSEPIAEVKAVQAEIGSEDSAGEGEHPIAEALERSRRSFAGDFGEPLGQFAAKCDLATGVHVPDFNCASGTLVPTTNHVNGKCDRPNRLERECDPGSHFQVVAKSLDGVAVAHCRKQGNGGNNYGDIAVIQYNTRTGATCYYQALGVLDGNFKAPVLGSSLTSEAAAPNPGAAPWLSNFNTHNIDCRSCHDNGAIIRSPYLAQLSAGSNALPGAGVNGYNLTAPVSFIGKDYQDWKLYSVAVSGNSCTSCHRIGYSNTSLTRGTALDFGLRATAASETAKNPHSAASPIWMIPGQVTYQAAAENNAKAIRDCAVAAKAASALPAGCSKQQFSSTYGGLQPAHLPILL